MNRVILQSSAKDLDSPLKNILSPYKGIDLSRFRLGSQFCRE
jgi:hypothetical protein